MLIRIVRAIAIAAVVCFGVDAQVQVQGTLTDAFGAPVTGSATFSWPSFQTSSGQAVVSGSRTVNVVNGAINLYLFPTALATPAVNYTVTIHSVLSGVSTTETWGIPTSGPATLQQVRNLSYAGGAGLAPYALQIGNVVTLSPGAQASANIRGNSPVQLLDLNLPGGTAGSTGAPGLTLNNFTVTRTSSTVLNVANVGNVTATGSGTGEVMIFYASPGPITVGLPAGVTATCDSGCVVAPGVTATPAGSILLYQWSMTAGAWDLNAGIDEHAFFQFAQIIPGAGIISSQAGNQITVQADPTYVQLPGSTPGGVGSGCTTGQYFLDTTYRWDCVASAWKRIAWGATNGGGSSMLDFQGPTSPLTMTGSPVVVYTGSAPVTLTAGQCITISVGASSSGTKATLELYADSTLIHTVYTGGSMGIVSTSSYCNLPGSTTVQYRFDPQPIFYTCSENGTIAATCPTTSTDGQVSTPTAVTWGATTHVLSLKATAGSGNVAGAWWKIVAE